MKILGIELKYSLRMFVAYEGITGQPFTLERYTDIIALIMAAVVTAPAVRSGAVPCPSGEEVYDYLDNHPGTVEAFTEWLAQSARPDEMMMANDTEGKKKA